MQGMIRCVYIAGLLYGCGPGDIDVPDAPVVGTSGLEISWKSSPESWPGALTGELTIEDVKLRFDSLRVIGDAGPGDPRTTASVFTVHWDQDSSPDGITFADAPVGLYSQLALMLDGNDFGGEDAYELRGHVTVSGTDYEWRVDDSQPLAINLGIDKMLKTDGVTKLEIDIDFGHVLSAINWDTVTPDSGRLEVDDGDTVIITEVRKKLVESFKTSSPSPGAR